MRGFGAGAVASRRFGQVRDRSRGPVPASAAGLTLPPTALLANPIGTFWSCVMLLEHLGEAAAAQRLIAAIEAVTANPALHTRDLGGTARTADVTRAVCEHLGR